MSSFDNFFGKKSSFWQFFSFKWQFSGGSGHKVHISAILIPFGASVWSNLVQFCQDLLGLHWLCESGNLINVWQKVLISRRGLGDQIWIQNGSDWLSAKMYRNLIWKSPGFVPFGANLTHFGSRSGHPDLGLYFLACFEVEIQAWRLRYNFCDKATLSRQRDSLTLGHMSLLSITSCDTMTSSIPVTSYTYLPSHRDDTVRHIRQIIARGAKMNWQLILISRTNVSFGTNLADVWPNLTTMLSFRDPGMLELAKNWSNWLEAKMFWILILNNLRFLTFWANLLQFLSNS